MDALMSTSFKTMSSSLSLSANSKQVSCKVSSPSICCSTWNHNSQLTVKLLGGLSRHRHRKRYGRFRVVSMEGADGIGQGKVEIVDAEKNLKISEMLQLLNRQLAEATAKEDYTEAAKVRDLMKSLEERDPILQLQKLLAQAVAEERYDDAAEYRDKLREISPPEVEEKKAVPKCNSNTVTKGVRVIVRSIYVRDRSTPSRQQYFFAYRVRVSNEGTRAVQLLNRHWVITDANGRVEEVRGPGVIGEQPVLRPGASFEYTSACPLRTPSGTMEGEYEMIYCDDSVPNPFEVKVGPFGLNVNDDAL